MQYVVSRWGGSLTRPWLPARCALIGVALVAGCGPAPPATDLLHEAEQLYLVGKYDEAIPLLKQRLLQNPEDAGAHFYLGTCYLFSTDNRWLGIARGELETALALFERQGKVCPIPRFDSSVYFEMICHINIAKIYLSLIADIESKPESLRFRQNQELLRTLLAECIKQYYKAERVAPGNPDVVALKGLIESHTGPLPPEAPEDKAQPTPISA